MLVAWRQLRDQIAAFDKAIRHGIEKMQTDEPFWSL
jgi:hypothetical protein